MEGVPHGEGMRIPGREEGIPLRYKRVDPHYFAALDIPLVAGRSIGAQDREGAPLAVVVNEELASQLEQQLESQSLVGRTVLLPLINYQMSGGATREYQIVGVARSERIATPGEDTPPVAYVSLAQVPRSYFKIVVRGAGSPSSLMAGVREAMGQVDPNLPLGDIRSFEQVRQRSLSGARQPAWLIGAFALAAAFLAALGLYGVLSHSVAQQRRDIGVRMALGARAADVVSQVLRSAAAMVGVGLIVGLAGAFAMTRLLETLLFEVSAWDPLAIAAACLATGALSLSAGWLPARRAAGVEPMRVLREDA
jgi:putative ABC transport system permease protein